MAKFDLNRGKKKAGDGWRSQVLSGTYVKVSEITADSVMQHRANMHDHVIEEYAEVFTGGGELAPVQIIRDENGTLWLWDGFHTLEAAKRAGVEKLRVKITPGTKRDAWLKSLGANAKHGVRRSRADLKKALDDALSDPEVKFSLLNEDQQHSYSSVAKLCATSHPTVSKRWNEHHLPLILAQIDREVRGDPPVGVSLQTWLDMVAEELHVPAWLVKQRKIEIGFTPEPSMPEEEPAAPEPEQSTLKEQESRSSEAASRQVPAPNAKTEDAAEESERPLVGQAPNSGAQDAAVEASQELSSRFRQAPNTKSSDAAPPAVGELSSFDSPLRQAPNSSAAPPPEGELTAPERSDHPLNPIDRLRVYPSEHTLAPITKKNLMEIVTGANKFGINAYHLDHAVRVKLVYELDKGEVQELELNPPHEGVLLLHFPLVRG